MKSQNKLIRKITIGRDYKNDAMHYSVGQEVYGGHCICTHYIKEKCYIRNMVNGKDTIVGNCCINHFGGRDLSSVFRALRDNRINPALLSYANEEDVINVWEFNFMMDVWRKRKFSFLQRAKYNQIKKKIYDACNMISVSI